MPQEQQVGVAISGGGYRATIWGLGALLYLADAGVHHRVSTVSSVSGGSIANASLATCGYRTTPAAELWNWATTVTRRCSGNAHAFIAFGAVHLGIWVTVITTAGTHQTTRTATALVASAILSLIAARSVGDATFGHPLPWLYLDLVAGSAAAVAYLVGEGSFGWLLALIGVGVLLLARGAVVGYAIERTLLTSEGRRLRLEDLPADAEHVLCATDLHGRHHAYFGRDFVYSYGFGLGQRPRLALGAAVQSSANLPFAFPPRPMRHGPFQFAQGRYRSPVLALTDGGVYDNMGEEWLLGYKDRADRFAARAEGLTDAAAQATARERARRVQANQPRYLVVVNASGPLGFKFAWTTFLPLLGEILTLLRVKSILYDNGNSVRRRLLVGQFLTGERTGILVHISTDPWSVIGDGRGRGGEVAKRADAAAQVLEATPGLDAQTTRTGVRAGTVLYPLPAGRAAKLAQRSYALTMVHALVWHDLPLVEIPSIDEFEGMERGEIPPSRLTV